MGLPASQRSSFRKYLSTNSTATSFSAVLANDKQLTVAQYQAFTVLPIGNSLTCQIIPFGAGADGQTFDYRVWGVYFITYLNTTTGKIEKDPCPIVRFIGGGTVTLGDALGVTGSAALATTDLRAKDVTFTKSGEATTPIGHMTAAETAYAEGASGDFGVVATATTVGSAFIPCLGRCTGIIVDFDMTGATNGNCLVLTDDV